MNVQTFESIPPYFCGFATKTLFLFVKQCIQKENVHNKYWRCKYSRNNYRFLSKIKQGKLYLANSGGEDFFVFREGLLLRTNKKISEGWCSWQWPNKKQQKFKKHSNSYRRFRNGHVFLANGIKHSKQPKRTSLLLLWLTWSSGEILTSTV